MNNITNEVERIIYKRDSEKEKQYGSFIESMEKTSKIASLLSNKEITTDDVYNILVALKLQRNSVIPSKDTTVDLLAYLTSQYEYRKTTSNMIDNNDKFE